MGKISALNPAAPLAGTETLVVVQSGTAKRALLSHVTDAARNEVEPLAEEARAAVDRVFGYPSIASGLAATNPGQKFRVTSPEDGVADAEYVVSQVPNLYNPAAKQAGKYVTNAGGIGSDPAWGCTGFIDVSGLATGASITISANGNKRVGLAFYGAANAGSYIAGSYNGNVVNATTTLTVTKPAGANFLVVNLYSNTIAEPSQVQIEAGASATTYYPFGTKLSTLVRRYAAFPVSFPDKSYEEQFVSPNLFDAATMIVDGSYLVSTGSGAIQSGTPGWGCTTFIPVTAGQSYTLSGTRGRAGIQFYTAANAASAIAGSYNGSTTLPLTVTAPAGAAYVVFNLYSSSAPSYSNVQFEEGDEATAFQAFGSITFVVKKEAVSPSIAEVMTSLKAALSTSTALGQASWSFPLGSKTAKINFSPNIALTHTAAQVFQFHSSSMDGVLQASSQGDDLAPYRVGGTTIGAGHGYARTVCTLTAHGKTAADLYSEWQDGSGNRWIIVLIDSANAFSVTAKTGNGAFAGGALTHVAGATNTGSVTPTSVAQSQLYPSIANRQFRLQVDGQDRALTDETIYPRSNLTFLESYDILNKNSMVAWLIANRAGADIPQYGGTSDIAVSHSYRFDDQGVVQTGDFLALQNVAAFQDIMFIQAMRLDEGTGNGTLKYYIPNAVSFVQDSVTYDFANGQDMTTGPANSISLTAARAEASPALLPDRVLMVNDDIGIAVGLLPVQSADPSVRRTNASRKALEVRNTSKKIYLSTIDRADKTSLTAGDYYSAVSYRRYFDPTQPRWFYSVPYGAAEYVYIHWQNKALTDAVPMPARLAGRAFTLIDSKNATVRSGVIGATLQVAVNAAGSNAHVVLLVS